MPKYFKYGAQRHVKPLLLPEKAQSQGNQTGGPQVAAAQAEGQQHQHPAGSQDERQVTKDRMAPAERRQEAVIDSQGRPGKKRKAKKPKGLPRRNHPRSLWSQPPDCRGPP